MDADIQCQELVQELILLQTRGSKLWLAIVGLPTVWGHLMEGMHSVIIRHTEMARKLTVLRAAVSSTMQSMLGRSPTEAFQVEVVDEVVALVQEQVEQRSCLENSGMRIYDLILGSPLGLARLADHLEQAIEWLRAEQVEHWEVNAELEGMWNSVSWV
jgi:LPS sulfotransferase NodH